MDTNTKINRGKMGRRKKSSRKPQKEEKSKVNVKVKAVEKSKKDVNLGTNLEADSGEMAWRKIKCMI